MKRERRYFFDFSGFFSFSESFLNDWRKKAFVILPLTFLTMPFSYSILGYHPEVMLFPVFVYLWHALFIYLGMTAALALKKYKYLAYPIIIILAFFCKDIASRILQGLGFQKNVMYISDTGEEFIMGLPLTPDEIMYYAFVLFGTSLLAGIFGAVYTNKTALEFVNKRSTFLFVNMWIISSSYYFFSGIMDIDKYAANIFVWCLTAFAVIYFMVRNFANLNRQLEVYAESGAYNVSGTKRIYMYYFSALGLMTIIPIIIGMFIIPVIVNILENIISFIVACFFSLLLLSPEQPEVAPSEEYVPDPLDPRFGRAAYESYELLAYTILLVIFIAILIIFRKHIIKLIKEAILFLKTKMNLSDSGNKNEIINQEIITEIKKEKKSKSSYKNYLKKAKKIKDLREKFLFAYSYLFWSIIQKDEDLKTNATPNEVAERYEETSNPAELYQKLKYGQQSEENEEVLKSMIEKTERFLREF